MFDKAKTLYELKKIQSALAKEMIEVETGNGAVKVKINGEQKIQKIELDPSLIDMDEYAVKEAVSSINFRQTRVVVRLELLQACLELMRGTKARLQ